MELKNMWPFKKKEIPAPIQQKTVEKKSFFSTDFNTGYDTYNKTIALQNTLKKSFQQPMINFKNVLSSGTAFAMDSQYSELTQAKMQNMSFSILPEAQISYFANSGFIGWQLAAMISQHWLVNKACTMPAEDAARNGYEITANDGKKIDPEVLDYMREKDKEFKVLPNCVELVRLGRVFGIRICLFLVDSPDPEYYEKPFNIDGVRPNAYKGMSQIDPYWVAPLLGIYASTDPSAKDFYEPTWWLINGKKVHRTHLVIFKTCDLPDILKSSYIYGGVPIPQWICERVYAAERTANEAPLLALSKRLITYKMDLTQAAANKEEFEGKLQYFAQLMNNFGVKVIGGEEEVNQFDTSLGDLDNVIMTQYQLVAAAAEVPATKLLGTTPKGFNATGEYDEKSYHEKLESIQAHFLSPLVERHHALLRKAFVEPKFGKTKFETHVNWLPVDAMGAEELADTNLKKAQADSIYSQTGAIDGVDIRNRLIADKDSGYNGMEVITEPLTNEEEVESDTTE